MSDIILLSGHTRDSPVLVLAYSADLRTVAVIGPDGLHKVLATGEVSIDYHLDPKRGWVGDFEPPQEEGDDGI